MSRAPMIFRQLLATIAAIAVCAPAWIAPAAGEEITGATRIAVALDAKAKMASVNLSLPILGIPASGVFTAPLSAPGAVSTLVSPLPFVSAGGPRPYVFGLKNAALSGPVGDLQADFVATLPGGHPAACFGFIVMTCVGHIGGGNPAQGALWLASTGGSGIFRTARVVAELHDFTHPRGTVTVSFPSAQAALDAVRQALAANASLSDAERASYEAAAERAIAQATEAPFPPRPKELQALEPPQPSRASAPEKAVVTHEESAEGGEVRVTVRVTVGRGDPQQTVEIRAVDASGHARTVLSETHRPGETVTATVTQAPPFIVQVIVNRVQAAQIEELALPQAPPAAAEAPVPEPQPGSPALAEAFGQGPAAPAAKTAPPAVPKVDVTTEAVGSQVRATVTVVVPQGPPSQRVRIYAVDASGHAAVGLDRDYAPGDVVRGSVTAAPPYVLEVYVNGVQAKEQQVAGSP